MLHLKVNSPRILLFKSMNLVATVFKLALVVALLALAIWGVRRGMNSMFIENQEYALREIQLDTNGSFTRQRVVEQTRIKAGATLFTLDPEFMEQKLGELPEVVSAKVTRSFPNTLNVNIIERVPVAWLHAPYAGHVYRDRKNGLLMSEDGFLFPCEGRLWEVAKNLPAVVVEKGEPFAFRSGEKMVHQEAARALSLVKLHQSDEDQRDWKLMSVKVINFYSLVAEYSDEVTVTYGMYDHRRQLADLCDIRKHAQQRGKEIRWLDLRPKRNIPGQYKVSRLD